MGYLDSIIKNSGNKFASVVDEGVEADVNGFVDTGSFAFNALLCGSMYGGIASNKILALAGESATGKTYFALGIVSKFLQDNKEGVVLYFDSEQAVTSEMFKSRGVDPKRVAVFPVATIEDFRHQAINIVDKILEEPVEKRKPVMIVLDSLGMLSTSKEMRDTSEGKDTRDMTRSQVIRATFRTLTLKLGKANIPMIMTNHTYSVIGAYVPTKEMSGGDGLKYAASTIVYLSKKKEKNAEGDVIGNIIHCKLYKSRLTKENQQVDVQLNYDSGLNKYYGLLDIAIKHGIFKKVSTRVELPDGKTAFEKNINDNPEKYFTDSVMKQLEEAVGKEFKYGGGLDEVEESPTEKMLLKEG
jgi:RecA/RadA recombinase